MCSEQTCLSRFVIEGHQGSKQPEYVCVHSVCAWLYMSKCVTSVRADLIITLTSHWGINIAYRGEKNEDG